MRIGIDLDGTACKTYDALRDYVAANSRRTGDSMPAPTIYNFWTEWGMTREEWWDWFERMGRAGEFVRMEPYPGFVDVARRLGRENQLVVITARHVGFPAPADVMEDTLRWLTSLEVPVGDVCFVKDKRAVRVDVLIDDAPHHLEQVGEAGVRAVAFDQPYNRGWRGERVRDWREFERLVLR